MTSDSFSTTSDSLDTTPFDKEQTTTQGKPPEMSSKPPTSETIDTMEWDSRADVIYHFYAYHFFDKGPRHMYSLDLINLDDADVQYYHRIADLARGLNQHHKLAEYLTLQEPYKLPRSHAHGITIPDRVNDNFKLGFRQRLIHHVRLYNLTQHPRRRFYLVGLTPADVSYARLLADPDVLIEGEQEGAAEKAREVKDRMELVFATDVCETLPAGFKSVPNEVEIVVEEFMEKREVEKQIASKDVETEYGSKMEDLRTTYAVDKTR